eukprot:3941385-Rhodomonas_salina.2
MVPGAPPQLGRPWRGRAPLPLRPPARRISIRRVSTGHGGGCYDPEVVLAYATSVPDIAEDDARPVLDIT